MSRPRPLDDLPSSPEFDAAGVRLPSAAASEVKRRAAASFSAGGSRLAGFIMARPLMVAVVAVAVVAAVIFAILAHAIYAVVFLAAGLAVAATGLLPYPAPNESKSGNYFMVVAMVFVFGNLIYQACIGELPGFPSTPDGFVFYCAGIVTVLCCIAVVVFRISLAFRRFGFFRPAACGYMVYTALLSILGIAAMNGPIRVGKPPRHEQASSGSQLAGPG